VSAYSAARWAAYSSWVPAALTVLLSFSDHRPKGCRKDCGAGRVGAQQSAQAVDGLLK